MNIRRYVFVATLVACAALLPIRSVAQWKLIGSFEENLFCVHFFDSTDGVVGGLGGIECYRHGVWSPGRIPDQNYSYISSIEELTPGVLYATSGDAFVWVSTDSGSTWQNTNTVSSFALSTYFIGDSLVALKQGSFARIDSNICIFSNQNGNVPSYSNDDGRTWHIPSGITGIGGFGVYGDTCRQMFFATGILDTSHTFYSLDSGHTWHSCGPKMSQDALDGSQDAVYHQCDSGVYCSVDAGTTWQLLGGPPQYYSQRGISGFGPKGQDVAAIDSGKVWLYFPIANFLPADPITRGDTLEKCPVSRIPIFVRPFTRPFQITFDIVAQGPQGLKPIDTTFELAAGTTPQAIWMNVSPTQAQSPTVIYIYTTASDGCRTFNWVDTFTIIPVPIPFTSPNVTMQNCTISRIPLQITPANYAIRMYLQASADSGWSIKPADTSIELAPNGSGTIWLTPTAPNTPNGTIIKLIATDTTACSVYSWDTSFAVHIQPLPYSITVIDSVGTNACGSIRIPMTMDLASCDSVNIDALTVSPNDSLLTLDTARGTALTRGKMDTAWIKFAPQGRNENTRYQVTLKTHFVPDGPAYDTTFYIKAVATGSQSPLVSAPASLSISACDPSPLSISVKTVGCEPVRIDSIQFFAPGVMLSGGPTAPDTISAGTIDTLRYTVESLAPGTHLVDATVYLYRMGDEIPFDTSIQMAVKVTSGSAQPLIASEPSLSLSNCDTSIVPFVISASCDSITISSATFTIPNSVRDAANLSFPLELEAGMSDSLLLRFPPQGLNTTSVIRAEIKGTYNGSSSTFDTTAQTQVTFACAGVTDAPGANSDNQNFPNPFGRGTNFTTTIPFTTSAAGIATIRIVDAAGNVILTQDDEVTYGGKHFFYFTGEDLPSGTYFYQIEFPKGIVIVAHSMLMVK